MNEMELVTDVPVIEMELDVVTRNYPVIPNPEGTPTDDISSMEIDNVIYAVKDETARTELENKVDKEEGKGLSEEDFTHTLKTKLDSVETGANKTIVDSSISSVSTNPVQNKVISDLINDMLPEKTKTGNPILITDASGMSAKSLKVELEPIQDLHGYDNPWAGGANKNKLPVTATSEEIDGITYTVASDGKITANGTATANSNFYVMGSDFIKLPTGEYTLNGCPSGGGTDSYSIRFEINGEYGGRDAGSGKSFELTNTDELKIYIRIAHGTQVNNMVFAPMVRPSSVADGTFVPYANICPIEGRTETTVSVNSEDTTVQFGQTVYGATVKSQGGTDNKWKIINLKDLTWTKTGGNARVFRSNTISDILEPSDSNDVVEAFCSCFYVDSYANVINSHGICCIWSDSGFHGQLWCDYDNNATLDEFKEVIKNQTFCYKLATPTTISTPATEISLAGGNNTIAGDGDMEITYSIGVADSYSKAETDTLLNGKVDKVDGKGLSTNDYTTAEKSKLDGIEAEANKTVVDVMISPTSTNPVQNKSIYDFINDLLPEATATGNPIAITNASGLNAKSLKVELEPIQDLNGYDSPWVGGGGKNKIDITKTWTNSQFITVSDNKVEIQVRGSGLTYNYCEQNLTLTGNVAISAKTDKLRSRLYLRFRKTDDSDWATSSDITLTGWSYNSAYSGWYKEFLNDLNISASIEVPSCLYFNLGLGSATGVGETITFSEVQIESGSSATSYAPYSNICPISGRTQTEISRTGLNIWNEQWENGLYDTTTGEQVPSTERIRNKYPIPINGNTQYYLYIGTANVNFRVLYYDKNGTFISSPSGFNNTTFTTPVNARYMNFYSGGGYASTYSNNVCINVSSSKNGTYESYKGEADTTIQFGQTIYGGEVDVTSGGTDSKFSLFKLSDTDSTKWQYNATNKWFSYQALNNTIKKPADNDEVVDIYCSQYAKTSRNYLSGNLNADGLIAVNTTGNILFRDLAYNTVQTFLQAYGNCQVLWERNTPTTINTPANEISLLKGNNALTGDGDMELIYSKTPQ